MLNTCHLHELVVAGSLVAHDTVDIDDVAAVYTHKAAAVEPRFDFADGQRTKQLVAAIKHVGVVRISVNRDDLIDRYKMGATITFDG